MSTPTHNPKADPAPDTNTVKDPADWTTGDEPMTGAQASYLKTLTEQANAPEQFSEDLSKAEASQRIDGLREQLGM
ncbi:DUF3072 domain-containing protein [Devosia sp.]|uniref:DUF3072 domain-containing protein n=1 Tax=Devosia sp. TaxID=1871048 RepID=UPI003A8E0947